jgi:murein endopeptidase
VLLSFAAPAWAKAPVDAGLGLLSAPGEAGELASELEDVDGGDDGPDGVDPEAEAGKTAASTDGGLRYTTDLTDDALLKRWVEDLPSLGSISVGFAEAGRLINGAQLPAGEHCTAVVPEYAWGTKETVDSLLIVASAVHEAVPSAPPLRVNHIGKKEGGFLRPHHSHQSGRDVDLGFYYRPGIDPAALKIPREQAMDLAANWALVRALATQTDTQLILLDYRVQKLLYDYALSSGEDRAWLDRLFHAGAESLLQHARRHRDHFHVRFFSARSQELGWRIQPLLAKRADENVVIHRVRPGDTLGHIAAHYGSGVKLIQRANGLVDTQLRVGRTLNVPLRGPCTQCPLPSQVLVPPRRLPPPPLPVSGSAGESFARGGLGISAEVRGLR